MSKKILLADDSITIQKVIELTFSDEDFDVVTVGNGRLALEKLPEVKPDIVLCDIIMPEKDGYEVCEQIKSSATFSHVPVLLLTGAFEPFDQERASQVRSDGFLAKPFEPETLIAKVKDLLSRAGAATTSATAASPVVEMVHPGGPAASSPGLIPDEPFAPIEAGDFEEAAPAAAGDVPLAAVTAEEAATLAGETPSGQSSADTSSTVMFKADDLPWSGGAPDPNAAPSAPGPDAPAAAPDRFGLPPAGTETVEPEPVFTPEPAENGNLGDTVDLSDTVEMTETADLADTAGAAFEEVLEEDLEFGAGLGEPTAPSVQAEVADAGPRGSAPADSPATQTQAPGALSGFGGADETPTLKTAVPAMREGPDSGAGWPAEREPIETFEPAAPEPPTVFAPEPSAPVEREPVETFEPAAAVEPPAFFEPEPPAAVEREPVETFEPVAAEPPAVFAPEPESGPEPAESFEPMSPASTGPVEAYEPAPPAAPEPIGSFEPLPPAAPEPVESYESAAPEVPEPIESYEPAAPEVPEPIESYEPAAPEVPEPIESYEPAAPEVPEPIESYEPAAPEAPEPIESYEPAAPEAPESIESYEPAAPEVPEPIEGYEPVAPSGRSANFVETLPPTGPPEFAEDSTPALEPEPELELPVGEDGEAAEGAPDITTLPGAAREDVVESFADLGPGDEPDPTVPSSEAASVAVPVDMVEKIAQRVVSQVSEKAVREIAWEVIPDLAEALIKQEIERLKAELQKP